MPDTHDDNCPDTPEELIRQLTQKYSISEFLDFAKARLDNPNTHAILMVSIISADADDANATGMDVRLYSKTEQSNPLFAFYIAQSILQDASHNLTDFSPFPNLNGEPTEDDE